MQPAGQRNVYKIIGFFCQNVTGGVVKLTLCQYLVCISSRTRLARSLKREWRYTICNGNSTSICKGCSKKLTTHQLGGRSPASEGTSCFQHVWTTICVPIVIHACNSTLRDRKTFSTHAYSSVPRPIGGRTATNQKDRLRAGPHHNFHARLESFTETVHRSGRRETARDKRTPN